MHRRVDSRITAFSVATATALGIVLAQYMEMSHSVPLIALTMVLWLSGGIAFGSTRTTVIGLSALVAAYAGAIGAFTIAFLWLILAVLATTLRTKKQSHTSA